MSSTDSPLPLYHYLQRWQKSFKQIFQPSQWYGQEAETSKGPELFLPQRLKCSRILKENSEMSPAHITKLKPQWEIPESEPGKQWGHFCIPLSRDWQEEISMLLSAATKLRGLFAVSQPKSAKESLITLSLLLPVLWRSCLCLEFSESSQRAILVKPCLFFFFHTFSQGIERTLQLRNVTLSGKNADMCLTSASLG